MDRTLPERSATPQAVWDKSIARQAHFQAQSVVGTSIKMLEEQALWSERSTSKTLVSSEAGVSR
jgi:hypothetical protein